jgi:hypothetical protein
MPRKPFFVCLSSVVLLVATAAHADQKDAAEQRFRAGVALQKVEDWDAAVVEFEASLALYETKSALFNLANALRAAHRYAEALAALERLQRNYGDQLDAEMRQAADSLTSELKSLTATLRLEVDPPGTTLRVDGDLAGVAPLAGPLRLGVGTHRVEASLDGYASATVEVNLSSREERTETLTLKALEPEPEPEPSPPVAPPSPALAPPTRPEPESPGPRRRTTAWITTGTGVALLGAGTVTGVWALSLDGRLQNDCLGEHCPGSSADAIDRLGRLASSTDALLIVGAVATVGGVTLLAIDRHQRQTRGASLRFTGGPGFAAATLGGRF